MPVEAQTSTGNSFFDAILRAGSLFIDYEGSRNQSDLGTQEIDTDPENESEFTITTQQVLAGSAALIAVAVGFYLVFKK